jgi:NitT/TauT family transport system permease protein
MHSIQTGNRGWLLSITSILVILVAWQIAASTFINPYFISTPVEVSRTLIAMMRGGDLWRHLLSTLTTTAIGFVAAAISGVALALLLGSNRFLDKTLGPFIFVAFSMPKVVLAPLLLLWLGVGKPPAIALAFITSFFLVFYNVLSGVRQVSDAYLNAAAVMGASRWQTALKIRLPAAAPFIATGLHQGLIYAFHGAILGEMTASNTGMGYLIIYAATSMDSNTVIAALVVIGAISYALIGILRFAGRYEAQSQLAGDAA